MLLQPSDLATFDTALNSADLLPPEASEPSAAFADILNLGLESGEPVEIPLGTLLPQAGNELPPPVLPDFDAVSSDGIESIPITNPDSLRVELRLSVPTSGAAGHGLNRGGPVTTVAPMPDPALPPGAPRAALPPTQVSLIPAELDAELPASDVPLPRGGKPLDAAALTPVPPPGPAPQTSIAQIARDLAAMPVAGTGATPLVNELTPGTRRVAPVEALGMPGKLGELSNRPADPLAPLTLAAGDERSGEIRPLPVTTSSAQTVQPQLQPVNTTELPAGQQAQPSPLQLTPAQSAAAAATAAPATQLTQSIDVPVKDQAWGDRIGERVLLMASNRLQSAEIRLTPAELGPLRVQVAVDDGAANVTFLAQHAATRDAIEQALPRLRELLAENGLTLNETNVGGHSEQGVHEGNPDNSDDSASLTQGTADPAADGDAADNGLAPRQPSRPDGLVDTFV
jgi:flagellar hook-length control protein FliK